MFSPEKVMWALIYPHTFTDPVLCIENNPDYLFPLFFFFYRGLNKHYFHKYFKFAIPSNLSKFIQQTVQFWKTMKTMKNKNISTHLPPMIKCSGFVVKVISKLLAHFNRQFSKTQVTFVDSKWPLPCQVWVQIQT